MNLTRVVSRFINANSSRIGYFFEGRLYNYFTKKSMAADDARKVLFVVVSRADYFEELRTFPFTNTSDVDSIIKNDIKANTKVVRYRILKGSNNIKVLLWHFSEAIDLAAPNSICLIPEGILASLMVKDDQLALVSGKFDEKFYFLKRSGVIYSRPIKRQVISPEIFLASIGVSAEKDACEAISLNNFQGNNTLESFSALKPFFRFRYESDLFKLLKSRVYWLGALCLVYQLAAGGAIYLSLMKAQSSFSEINESLTDVFVMQQQAADKVEVMSQIDSQRSGRKPDALVWKLLHDAGNVEWLYFEYLNTKLTVSGSAVDALEVLNTIKALDYVEAAEFDSAIRNVNDKEGFQIQVSLKVAAK